MNTTEQLIEVFNDNFVAYYRSHVAHVNITGRNFHSDHKLLQKVYEDLQDQIDNIAEMIRTLDEFMPNDLFKVLGDTSVNTDAVEGDADSLLEMVRSDLEQLITCTTELMEIAEEEGHKEIANYAQDRILAINKFIWMLRSTLE